MARQPKITFSVPASIHALTTAQAEREGVSVANVCLRALAAHHGVEAPDMPPGLGGADAETVSRVGAIGGRARRKKRTVK